VSELPETRFIRVDDLDIAYQVVGPAGGLDLVFVPGWVSYLEVMRELPEFARFLDRLAAMGRLIMFDKRGTGLSDRVAGVPTLEQRADDIVAVMEAAGSARAAIAAWGEGAGIAAMFAATYPERVVALVLGSIPLKITDGSASALPDPAVMETISAAVENGWGQASPVLLLAPSRAEDTRFLAWYRRRERLSSTPGAAAATLRWAMRSDLGPVLPAIQARTLLVHRRDAALIDPESVQVAAKLIPDARCTWLPGAGALPYVGDTDAIMDVIQEFLTGAQGTADSDRSLATVLFTDIVGSTQTADGSATAAGGTCSTSTTPGSAGYWTGSAAWRSTRRGTASSPPSTARPGPSGARAPSGTRCARSASRSGRPAHRGGGASGHRGGRPGGPCRRARRRPGSGQRGAGHQYRADAGPWFGDRLRRPRAAQVEGRSRPVAAVRGGVHLMADIPETQYARSGHADIAYQVFGAGADLVAIHGLPGHLEVMWELPDYAAFLDRLGTFGRMIMFDKRGTGMSDRVPGVPAVEQHMEDIIAVMDAAGSSRAAVLGWADGAFMAAMLAATYPERVSALVLGGLCLKALTGGWQAPTLVRSLATVLFTDIVRSTEKASDLGDRRWRYLLEDHHARVRRALERLHGAEVDTAGDGFFATFDGPARAIRSACVIRGSLRDIGIQIRAGPHTGEVERRGTGATGLAVHVGARGCARPGQRGPGHQHRKDAGTRPGDRLRRSRAVPAEGRP
jgi:pimeloyl-ACP methyl ester carboxylesterase